MQRNPSSPLGITVAVCILLLLYIGLYILDRPAPNFSIGTSPASIDVFPLYKSGGRTAKTLFWPLWKLDMQFFPSHWTLPHVQTSAGKDTTSFWSPY